MKNAQMQPSIEAPKTIKLLGTIQIFEMVPILSRKIYPIVPTREKITAFGISSLILTEIMIDGTT
ncbi:hypothetical protein FJZ18_03960 [Candidatus Pacearchaeota archaeon]|nr:hypothetical protein [Candidatus Pacearchaeota archaeon]